MHIHDQNLNVLFLRLHVSTKSTQVIQHMLLTHIPSIQDADWFSLCGTFSRNQAANVCEGHHPIENEDVLGLVVGSWAHFQFFSVANTRTWHKSSAVTSKPHSPVPLNQMLGTSLYRTQSQNAYDVSCRPFYFDGD